SPARSADRPGARDELDGSVGRDRESRAEMVAEAPASRTLAVRAPVPQPMSIQCLSGDPCIVASVHCPQPSSDEAVAIRRCEETKVAGPICRSSTNHARSTERGGFSQMLCASRLL